MSRHGKVTEHVLMGMVAMAFHFAEFRINSLISTEPDTLDPVTKTPAYKTCPVRIIKNIKLHIQKSKNYLNNVLPKGLLKR